MEKIWGWFYPKRRESTPKHVVDDLSQSPGYSEIKAENEGGLPVNLEHAWKCYVDERTGQQYYYNSVSKISQWKKPPCLLNAKEKEFNKAQI